MKLEDSFALSVNNILHRKLRAWLTLLGIIIGVGALVSIVSISEGANMQIQENLSGFGADVITISPGFSRAGAFTGGFRGGGTFTGQTGPTTDEPALGKLDLTIIRGHPNIAYVNETVRGSAQVVYLSQTINASIQGVNPATVTQTDSLELESGRLLGASDSGAVVIGSRIANEIFSQPITIGRRLEVEGKPFTVVGILKEGSNDSAIYMNYTSAWDVTDVNMNNFSSIRAKLKDSSAMEQTTEELTRSLQIVRKVTERDQDFSISSPLALREQINSALGTLSLFLGAIAAVSLVVGAVGIANSMFTSVLEKTREIGIMKALGSTDSEILQLFVIESAIFGLVGGTIGVIFGMLVSSALSTFAGLNTTVPVWLMAFAIAISTIIGIVSGIMPARSASKLRPVEALRYE